jgi:hypothetical protein
MKSFKQYLKELYTIGHTRSYDASKNRIQRNKEAGATGYYDTTHVKIGKSKGEPGGAAYKTVSDAEEGARDLKKDFPGRNYSVYKMNGDFHKDTYYNKDTRMHHIKKDTEILHKVKHNVE